MLLADLPPAYSGLTPAATATAAAGDDAGEPKTMDEIERDAILAALKDTGGNRERDKRTGFSIPMKLTLAGMLQFALKPAWGINYVTHEKFALPQLDEHVDMSGGAMSIGRYFTEMLEPTRTGTTSPQ